MTGEALRDQHVFCRQVVDGVVPESEQCGVDPAMLAFRSMRSGMEGLPQSDHVRGEAKFGKRGKIVANSEPFLRAGNQR